jgi:transposase
VIRLTHESRILLAIAPADFRAGIDGMSARCRQVLEQDPSSGAIVVFINRAHTMIRALSYDGNGYWLMTKRLSRGTFEHWPRTAGAMSRVSAHELTRLIQCKASQNDHTADSSRAPDTTHTAHVRDPFKSVPVFVQKPLASAQR